MVDQRLHERLVATSGVAVALTAPRVVEEVLGFDQLSIDRAAGSG